MRFVFPLVLALTLAPGLALAQTCAASLFGDGVCDCGCGTVDPDCPVGAKFTACGRNHCAAGTVPWEHNPHTCMTSACGDGWNDPTRGEACDDKNALSSGGCSAACASVNPGYVCGAGASGCQLAPVDAGQPDAGQPDGGPADAGSPGAQADAGETATGGGGGSDGTPQPAGCSAGGTGLQEAALLAWLLSRLARRSR